MRRLDPSCTLTRPSAASAAANGSAANPGTEQSNWLERDAKTDNQHAPGGHPGAVRGRGDEEGQPLPRAQFTESDAGETFPRDDETCAVAARQAAGRSEVYPTSSRNKSSIGERRRIVLSAPITSPGCSSGCNTLCCEAEVHRRPTSPLSRPIRAHALPAAPSPPDEPIFRRRRQPLSQSPV